MRKSYNKGQANELEALSDISFSISQGEMVAIMGRSGSGKSTLMHILGGLLSFDSGEYYLNGEKIEKLKDRDGARLRNEKIGMVMQNFALVDEFTALENVMLPLDFHKKKISDKKKKAQEALEKVDMQEYARQICKTMSGGQKQRVAIARAIVNQPLLLMADEPTGALDRENSKMTLELFRHLHENGMTILLITHDPWVADQCDRILTIQDGCIL